VEYQNVICNYVARKINDLFILVNIKENTLYEVDEEAYLIFEFLKNSEENLNYSNLSTVIGKDINELELLVNELVKNLSE